MTLACANTLTPTTEAELQRLVRVEEMLRAKEEEAPFSVPTEHLLHAGVYARTIRLSPGDVIVGVMIDIPTVVVVNGDCRVLLASKWHHVKGYYVLPGMAKRKQLFHAFGNTEITMIFATEAKTVEEAEREFTSEAESLLSRRQDGNEWSTVTGVSKCQA